MNVQFVTCPGKDTEQLGKLVTAYSTDPTLVNADEVLDVRTDLWAPYHIFADISFNAF